MRSDRGRSEWAADFEPVLQPSRYRAFLSGKVESLLGGYASLVDGVAWDASARGH